MNMRMMIGVSLVLLVAYNSQAGFAWDVLDVEYGNGTGQVAATGGGAEAMDWYYPSTNIPTETLSDGKTTLTPNGTNYGGYSYAGSPFTMPSDGSWSLEFKTAIPAQSPLNIELGDGRNDTGWQWLVTINSVYSTEQTNAISDYNQRSSAVDIAPAGFDSSQMNSYIFAFGDDQLKLYVNGVFAGDISTGSAGGVSDGFPFLFALSQTVDVAAVRISESTYVPEPASISLISAGLIAVAFKRRKK